MAKLEPKEISLSEINNGNEYENGDIVDAKSINSAIEASAYAQGKANEALDWVKGQGIPYHIGAIYMSTNSTSPASLFGGTWEQIKDRFLLGAGSSYSAGDMGGEATHTLTEWEMPSHRHGFQANSWTDGTNGTTISKVGSAYPNQASFNVGADWGSSGSLSIAFTGGNGSHNNMPPYLAVYIWKRTA